MGAPSARAAAILWLLCAALWGTAGAAQTWFDALVARVNGDAILASDITLEDVLFGAGRTFADMDREARRAVLARLIERRLLLTEAARFGVAEPTEAAVAEAVERIRRAPEKDPAGFDPATIRAKVRNKLWADAFVQARIRAFVFIRDAQVEEALERLPPPATAVERDALEERVRRELAEREAARRLSQYLARLESRATIRRYPLPGEEGPP